LSVDLGLNHQQKYYTKIVDNSHFRDELLSVRNLKETQKSDQLQLSHHSYRKSNLENS